MSALSLRPLRHGAGATAPPRGGPRIVLVEPDPYLAFLLRLNFPTADVVEADPAVDAAVLRGLHPDLVIVGVAGSVAVSELMAGEKPPKVLAVVDAARASRTTIPSAVEGILARPFAPAELSRAVSLALGMGDPEEAPGLPGRRLSVARAALPPVRFVAVATAAVLEVAGTSVSQARAIILALAFAYVAIRWLLRRPSVVWLAADVAIAASLVAATGGVTSPYIPFALVVAAGNGLTHNERWGMLSGLVIAAASTPTIAADLGSGFISTQQAVVWFLVMPLAGLTGGFASRLWRQPSSETGNLLAEANHVLSSLYRIARTLPGGLEIGTVADSAMDEVRDTVRASAGAMLVSEAGSLAVASSFGIRNPEEIATLSANGLGEMVHGGARILTQPELDADTAQALGGFDCWIVAPMKRGGAPLGLLIAACPDHEQHAANRLLLQQLAEDTAVAVENARIFSRVRELSIDEERKRLARELHDGVAQALTHLRFELEFMARHGGGAPDSVKREVERLARVVSRASSEVRSMIFGLRSSVSAEGLVGSLRGYVSDLRGLGGPEILFESRGEVRLLPGVEAEVFRVAQEALSNALRHAGASEVRVGIVADAGIVRLTVEDDGVGIRTRRAAGPRGGVGLDAMRERAEAIEATFAVEERIGGGTRVSLEYEPEMKG